MMAVLILILFSLLVLYVWTIAFTLHRKLDSISEQLNDLSDDINKDDFGIEQANETEQ